MGKDDINFFMLGAKYFQKDYFQLKNNNQYKQEYYLGTSLSRLRMTRNLKIYTSCIASTDYLYKVIKPPLYDVEIFYYETNVNIDELKKHYEDEKVEFIKLAKNPREEFSNKNHVYNTIVFAVNEKGESIVFDNKMLGNEKEGTTKEKRKESKKVYRAKYKENRKKLENYNEYKEYYSIAMNLMCS